MAAKRKFRLPSDNDDDAQQEANDFSAHTRFKNRLQNVSAPSETETRTSSDDISKKNDIVEESQTTVVTKPATAPKKTNCILVNPRQRGNPILKFVRNVPYEYSEITPDYIMGQSTCALFLSLRYHTLKPEYIHDRLKQLGHQFGLTVLLVQIDMKDPHHSVKELTKIAILAHCTLILAWSPEEAGRYLEIYKAYENKPPDLIKERSEAAPVPKLVDAISSVKSVNRTNAMTLLHTFKSVHNIAGTKVEDLSLCPGMGQNRASRLHAVLNQPFLKNRPPNATE